MFSVWSTTDCRRSRHSLFVDALINELVKRCDKLKLITWICCGFAVGGLLLVYIALISIMKWARITCQGTVAIASRFWLKNFHSTNVWLTGRQLSFRTILNVVHHHSNYIRHFSTLKIIYHSYPQISSDTCFYGSHCNNVKMTRPVTFLKVGLMQFLQHSLQMSTFQRFCTSKYFFLTELFKKCRWWADEELRCQFGLQRALCNCHYLVNGLFYCVCL